MNELNTSSVSRKQLILEIRGKAKISCDLKRHLSPRTVGTIMRSLPLEGNAHLLGKSILYFETSVDSGTERSRSEFKKGDVAFLPSSGSICFFLNDVVSGKTMTPIGKLGDDVDILKNVKSGDILSIYEDTA
ncbi:MAG: cyclophilin-like fold protein [Candidatus Nitrosopumilus sp. bin_68KS]